MIPQITKSTTSTTVTSTSSQSTVVSTLPVNIFTTHVQTTSSIKKSTKRKIEEDEEEAGPSQKKAAPELDKNTTLQLSLTPNPLEEDSSTKKKKTETKDEIYETKWNEIQSKIIANTQPFNSTKNAVSSILRKRTYAKYSSHYNRLTENEKTLFSKIEKGETCTFKEYVALREASENKQEKSQIRRSAELFFFPKKKLSSKKTNISIYDLRSTASLELSYLYYEYKKDVKVSHPTVVYSYMNKLKTNKFSSMDEAFQQLETIKNTLTKISFFNIRRAIKKHFQKIESPLSKNEKEKIKQTLLKKYETRLQVLLEKAKQDQELFKEKYQSIMTSLEKTGSKSGALTYHSYKQQCEKLSNEEKETLKKILQGSLTLEAYIALRDLYLKRKSGMSSLIRVFFPNKQCWLRDKHEIISLIPPFVKIYSKIFSLYKNALHQRI